MEGTSKQSVQKLFIETTKACIFCKRMTEDEVEFGGMKGINNFRVHYYCLLLSENIEQKGDDHEGILGFMPKDIMKEVKMSKYRRCRYCKEYGANLGCVETGCRRKYHLPCGLMHNSQQNFNEFTSRCKLHRKKSNVPKHLQESISSYVCIICFENFDASSTSEVIRASCCKSNVLLHIRCIKLMALNAGYYTKCPRCNDGSIFNDLIKTFGVFIPERDASWELEENAFADMMHVHNQCDIKKCVCPQGRKYFTANGKWKLRLCTLCGSYGAHYFCSKTKKIIVCDTCASKQNKNIEEILPTTAKTISNINHTVVSNTDVSKVKPENDNDMTESTAKTISNINHTVVSNTDISKVKPENDNDMTEQFKNQFTLEDSTTPKTTNLSHATGSNVVGGELCAFVNTDISKINTEYYSDSETMEQDESQFAMEDNKNKTEQDRDNDMVEQGENTFSVIRDSSMKRVSNIAGPSCSKRNISPSITDDSESVSRKHSSTTYSTTEIHNPFAHKNLRKQGMGRKSNICSSSTDDSKSSSSKKSPTKYFETKISNPFAHKNLRKVGIHRKRFDNRLTQKLPIAKRCKIEVVNESTSSDINRKHSQTRKKRKFNMNLRNGVPLPIKISNRYLVRVCFKTNLLWRYIARLRQNYRSPPPLQSSEPSATPPLQSAEPSATPPLQSAEPSATPPLQSAEPSATPPLQSAEPSATPPLQSAEPSATPPLQSAEPSATPPLQSAEPSAIPPLQSAEPLATPPLQAAEPSLPSARQRQQLFPSEQPPSASGVTEVNSAEMIVVDDSDGDDWSSKIIISDVRTVKDEEAIKLENENTEVKDESKNDEEESFAYIIVPFSLPYPFKNTPPN